MTKIKLIVPVLAFAAFSNAAFAGDHSHHHSSKSKADSSYFGFDTGYGYGAHGEHYKGISSSVDEITADNTDFDFEKTSSSDQSIFYGYHLSDDFRLELSLNNHQYREKLYSSSTSVDETTTESVPQIYSVNSFIDGGIIDLLVSGYFDFNLDQAWTPYVGLGIGYGSAHYKEFLGVYQTDSSTVGETATDAANDSSAYTNLGRVDKGLFTYQAALGVKFDMSPSTSFDLGYKYHGASVKELTAASDPTEYTHSFKFRPGAHIVSIGATYRF